MRDRTLFHDQINERNLPFYLQRKGGTVEDYIAYSEDQVLAFTPEEEQLMASCFAIAFIDMDAGYASYPNPEILEDILSILSAEKT